jgi:hypothetical protein
VYFQCKLGEFVYPNDPEGFQKSMAAAFGEKGLPRMSATGPDTRAEGYFALVGQNVLVEAQCKHGDEAWINAVENVSKAKDFSAKNVVFLRGSIRKDGKKQRSITPKFSAETAYYPVRRGGRYIFELYYRYPIQDENREARTQFIVSTPDLVSPLGPTQMAVNARNSTEYLRFSVKRFPEEKQGSLSLVRLPESGKIAATDETFLPGVAIDLRVTERWFFWPLVVLLLLVYACLGIAAGTDFDKLLAPLEAMKQLSTVQAMEKSLLTFGQNYWLFLKGAASFLQAIALLVLFGMLGKKIS